MEKLFEIYKQKMRIPLESIISHTFQYQNEQHCKNSEPWSKTFSICQSVTNENLSTLLNDNYTNVLTRLVNKQI